MSNIKLVKFDSTKYNNNAHHLIKCTAGKGRSYKVLNGEVCIKDSKGNYIKTEEN